MRSTLLRRATGVALLGGIVAGSVLGTAGPASAELGPNEYVVAAGGSDTTENIMGEYLAGQDTSFDGTTTYDVETYNIPAFPTAAGYDVPNDTVSPASCNAVGANPAQFPGGTLNWKNGGTPTAPSGSGAGRTRLALEKTNGRACLDIGRSSSKGSEAGFQYYGFALDAVAWASPSLKAPAVMTRQQVKDIFLCNITDWATVGGVPGQIQRYIPQSTSGTLSVFIAEFLDGAAIPTTGTNCPAVKQTDKNGDPMEENQGNTIAKEHIDQAILPYSSGVWVFQKNNSLNPTLDKRNGVRLGGLTTVTGPVSRNAARWNTTNGEYELDYVNLANPGGVVSDQNTTLVNGSFSKVTGYSGVRFLFNVVDSGNPLSYGPAVGLVGFDNASPSSFKSPLCNGGGRDTILTYGFAPLTSATGPSNLAGSTCRRF